MEVYETLPIVPLRDVVVFPHMMMPFVIGRPSSTRALEHALVKDKRIFLAAQHDASIDDPRPDDIFTTITWVSSLGKEPTLTMPRAAWIRRMLGAPLTASQSGRENSSRAIRPIRSGK